MSLDYEVFCKIVNSLLPLIGAVAAVFSAISAWKAWAVAKSTFNFQEKLIKSKKEIELLSSLIEKLIEFKSVSQFNILEMPDEKFLIIENFIPDINNLITELSSQDDNIKNRISTWKQKLFNKNISMSVVLETSNSNIRDPFSDLHEHPGFLDHKIKELKNIRDQRM